MAVLSSNFLTLADLAAQLDPDGKPAVVIDLLSQSNPVVMNMLWTEGNLPTGHKITQRTSLPQGTWRALGQGVQSQKSTTAQITESCGMLEGVSEVDVKLAELGGNPASVLMNEDMAFAEGLTQQFATNLFYGDEAVLPNSFNGLSKRYGSTSATYGAQAQNVIDMGGQNSVNTSIWVVTWGANCTAGIFPKGTVAGLQHEDMGKVVKYFSDGSSLVVFQNRWNWQCGIAVADWRYNVRLANIDSTLVGTGTSSPDLIQALISALSLLPTVYGEASYNTDPTKPSGVVGGGRTEIYMNRTVATALTAQASYRKNMFLMQDQFAGKPRLSFQGIPIRITDALLNTEARVTAAQPV
jgi:hypothetical protein